MGLNAEIIAIGPFSHQLVPHLEYPAAAYVHTREGVTIAVTVFFIETGSTASRDLAACFGVDPWDFNQHELDASRAELDSLRCLFEDDEVSSFVALRDAGFRFFFLPNG